VSVRHHRIEGQVVLDRFEEPVGHLVDLLVAHVTVERERDHVLGDRQPPLSA
jgi:hypothetical protein